MSVVSQDSEFSAASEAPEKGRRLIAVERRFLYNPLRNLREEGPSLLPLLQAPEGAMPKPAPA